MNEFTRERGKQTSASLETKFISISKIDSKGRLLIPKKVREIFSGKDIFILLKGGRIELVPNNSGPEKNNFLTDVTPDKKTRESEKNEKG